MKDHEHQEPDELRLPAALQRELKARYGQPVFIPSAVDDAVMAKARRHLVGRAGRRVISFPRLLATAAAVVLAAGIGFRVWHQRPATLVAREDINGDGRVDIVDAFTLAQRLQRHAVGAGPDINGDGVVDQRDVEAIAAAAVKLSGGRG